MHGRSQSRFSISAALRRNNRTFLVVGLFSGLINVLALTGSLYMLQVYDRVLPSHSIPTLVVLTVLMVFLYLVHGVLDFIRTRIMARVGLRIDRDLRSRILEVVLLLPLRVKRGSDGLQPVRDLDQIRSFLSGLGPTALFDLPWLPVYLALVFLLHPSLGWFATAGALALILITLLTELQSTQPVHAANASGAARMAFGESARRNAEVIQAMGMNHRIDATWDRLNRVHMDDQLAVSDKLTGFATASKIMRLLLQSGILGLGAFLAVRGEVTGGAIIAASITMSRALAPIELAIAHWRSFVAARQSYARLKTLFAGMPETEGPMDLPRPNQNLSVAGLTVAAPGESMPILRNVSFTLSSGSGLGIIGPSASGKSTLVRALVGAWLPLPRGGTVRLDGATLDQYGTEALGRDIGYMPQDIELFDGTVAQNIARLDPQPVSEQVVAAAKLAGVHDMILTLPDGYNTRVGEGGSVLSAGQRQRIALARALYGDPFLVVLDEPNSNLDANGDRALTEAITAVRKRQGIVIVVAHRPAALAGVDQLLAMSNGTVAAFGEKDQVLKKVLQSAEATTQRAGSIRIVPETGA